VPNSGTTKIRGDSDDLAKIRGSNSWSAVSSTADVARVGVQELKVSSSLDTVGHNQKCIIPSKFSDWSRR
jgi:hypothetical protein